MEGDAFVVVEADHMVPDPHIFDADYVLDQFEDRNEECCSEDGLNADVTPKAKIELTDALADTLAAWLKENGIGKAWSLDDFRNEEEIAGETTT